MTRLRSVSILLLLLLTAGAQARVFVSLAGTLLEAEINSVKGDAITLKRLTDDQVIVVNRKTLCKEDNAFITRWIEQNPGAALAPAAAAMTGAAAAPQKFSLSCQVLPAKSNRGAADGGERTLEISYSFILNNREVTRDLQNARGLVVVLGKNAAESNGDLIVMQKEEFDVAIRAQSKMTHATAPVRLTYSQGSGIAYGVKTQGYVLIVRDSAGNTLFVEASPDSGAKYAKEILALSEVPCVVDRDFKLRPNTVVPMGYISF